MSVLELFWRIKWHNTGVMAVEKLYDAISGFPFSLEKGWAIWPKIFSQEFFWYQSISIIITINVKSLFLSKFKARFLLQSESCRSQTINFIYKINI